MVERIVAFIEHLSREDHFDDEAHQENLESIEKEFHKNNFGPERNIHLSVRPHGLHCNAPEDSLWSAGTHSMDRVQADAQRFTRNYEADVQLIFSHVQHHWHKIGKDGKRTPMKYCEVKHRVKQRCCKAGYPKKVILDKN